MENKANSEKIIAIVSFLVMIIMNILANLIPINGMTTRAVINSYPTLFSPANYAFSIWTIIYLLLAAFAIYQLDLFHKKQGKIMPEIYHNIRMLYITTCFLNATWILAWHYDYIAFSLMASFLILICLIIISHTLSLERLTRWEKLFIRLPFSIYFGWITIATINNFTALLVSIRWKGFGISESIWTMIILAFTVMIVSYTTLRNRDLAYCLAIIWAYIGILAKHLSKNGLDGHYPQIINIVIICIILLTVEVGYLLLSKKNS